MTEGLTPKTGWRMCGRPFQKGPVAQRRRPRDRLPQQDDHRRRALAPQPACTTPGCGGTSTHRRDFAADSLHMAGWVIANAIHDCAAPGV
jgi:hypothetical protein